MMDQMAGLELSMFQMMDLMAELVLELVLTMFRMKMDQMAELDVVLVMELASLGLVMFQMMDRKVALVLEMELSMFQMMDWMVGMVREMGNVGVLDCLRKFFDL